MRIYNCILLRNKTADCNVTLFIYYNFDPICRLSKSSKILKPGQSYLYRSKNKFKFKITKKNEKGQSIAVGVTKWAKDSHITILNDDYEESDLEDHALEKTICLRQLNVEKEVSLNEGNERRHLYEILKLDYKKVKTLDTDKQDKIIKTAFFKEIKRWHPDKAGKQCDLQMTCEVLSAYFILKDPKRRADFHNKADYSEGWLSKARYKSIFRPEWHNEEQQQKHKKRLVMMGVSFVATIVGFVIIGCTAGAAAPVVVGICGALGAGLSGGGLQSLFRTINQKSIEEGCDFVDFISSFGLGFFAGLVTGGASVGISAGIVGLGSAATATSATTFGQFITMGAGSGSIGGVCFSLAVDAEKKLVDGVEVTWKQFLGHTLASGIIGAITGVAVGAVSGGFACIPSNIEGQFARRFGITLGKNFSSIITNKSSETILGSTFGAVEERLDDDQENRPFDEHLQDLGKQLIAKLTIYLALGFLQTFGDQFVMKNTKPNNDRTENNCNKPTDLNDSDGSRCQNNSDSKLKNKTSDSKTTKLQWDKSEVKAKYNNPEKSRENILNFEFSTYCSTIDDVPVTTARFKLLTNKSWFSKMIVEFKRSGRKERIVVCDHGSVIEIPKDAKDVYVYFKAMRFIATWCAVKKWNRFEEKWHDEPHIFRYENPPEQRTFTLGGSLYFEGVIGVTDERHDDVDDM